MTYDPFRRGPFPAGVRTLTLTDERRGRRALPVEVWYPADDQHAGEDTDRGDVYEIAPGLPRGRQQAVRDAMPRPGRWPLVVFSHGYTGHRRQSTFLCTQLASHGYAVAAVDHTGNTVLDLVHALRAGHTRNPDVTLRSSAAARPPDVSFVLDHLLAGEMAGLLDPGRIGMTGHSFGGWTTLEATGRDPRIRAALPLAPAGGEHALGANVLGELLDLSWQRDVPTLFVVAERDTLLPLPGMRELLARTQAPKRMVVIHNADHMHFCDQVEQVHELFRLMPADPLFAPLVGSIPPIGKLCPGAHAHDVVRALGLAHFDAVLRDDPEATAWLAGDVCGAMAERGIGIDAG